LVGFLRLKLDDNKTSYKAQKRQGDLGKQRPEVQTNGHKIILKTDLLRKKNGNKKIKYVSDIYLQTLNFTRYIF
jgi:hypothetical protein